MDQASTPGNRTQTRQRVVTAVLSSLFVLLFLMLLDRLILEQLRQRALDNAMAQMHSVQRMNYQGMLQWISHEQRQLAWWLGAARVRALLDDDIRAADAVAALHELVAEVGQTHAELRDVLILDENAVVVLASNPDYLGQPSPLAKETVQLEQLRRHGFLVSPPYVTVNGTQREHRLLLAAPLDAAGKRVLALSLSPDAMYLSGPASADPRVTNYLVDDGRHLHRFDRPDVSGTPTLQLGQESWYRYPGISWPPIRHLKLDVGVVEWREAYLGVGGERVYGLWTWQNDLQVGLLSEMKVDDALVYYTEARFWVVLITAVIAGMFSIALLVTTVVHVRLFGDRQPGVVLQFWLRLWPWPWVVTVLGFAAVVAIMVVLGLKTVTLRSSLIESAQLSSAQEMSMRALDVWHRMTLANVQLWARAVRVRSAATQLLDQRCAAQGEHCAAHAILANRLASLVRSGDHQAYAVMARDGRILSSSPEFDAAAGMLLAVQPALLKRAAQDGALLSPIVRSRQPQPAERGEYLHDQPLVYAVAPVQTSSAAEAFLVLQLNPHAGLFASVEASRFGASGESYLVDARGRMISHPRSMRLQGVQSIRLPAGPVTAAAGQLQPGMSLHAYADYRGVRMVGAWRPVNMLNALLVTEIDNDEAMRSLRSIRIAMLLVAVVGFITFVGTLSAQYLVLLERLEVRTRGVQMHDDAWSRWGNRPNVMTMAVALGAFVIQVIILALMSWFDVGDVRLRWFATAAMFTALLLPFIHVLILKPATHANLLLTQWLARSAEQEERYRLTSEDLARANAELQRIADVDQLTGIANRRHLDNVMTYEIDRCQRSQQSLAVLLLDVDHFKLYNDNYGHTEGDTVLRQLGAVLRQCAKRSTDLVARYGGEEFCIVLPNTDAANAIGMAESILAAVEKLSIPHAYSTLNGCVTVSIGVFTAIPQRDDVPTHFYQQADQALYRAKHAGRNQVQLAVDD